MAAKKGRTKSRAKARKATSGKKRTKKARSTRARKPKLAAKKAPARTAKKAAAPAKPVTPPQPEVLDEVIEEPILDASGILKLKDAYARAKHDTDEDDANRFADPSLVVEAEKRRREGSLFDEEARRQEETPVPPSEPASSSLFGALKKKPEA